jgi:hypothetical protein
MATRKSGLKRSAGNECLGLTAIGSAGDWEVAVDETTSATRRWFAQVEGPSVYLSFEVESPNVIGKILDFLTEPKKAGNLAQRNSSPRNGELVIGKSVAVSVTLLRDEEFPDRYFLVAETAGKFVVRVTLGGKDLIMLESALRQVQEDLADEDAD